MIGFIMNITEKKNMHTELCQAKTNGFQIKEKLMPW